MKIDFEKFKNPIKGAKDDCFIRLRNRSFGGLPIRMKPGFQTL